LFLCVIIVPDVQHFNGIFAFKYITFYRFALVAWHSGHYIRLQNRISSVRIPPGYKVFKSLYIAVLLS
jgi:hypothetical protein